MIIHTGMRTDIPAFYFIGFKAAAQSEAAYFMGLDKKEKEWIYKGEARKHDSDAFYGQRKLWTFISVWG